MALTYSSGDLYSVLGSASDTMGNAGQDMLKRSSMPADLEFPF